MGRSTQDLAIAMEIWCSPKQSQLDPTIPPLYFNRQIYNSETPLKIGFYTTDNFFEASEACSRAVTETARLLRSRGHVVVEFAPPEVPKAMEFYYGLLSADGGKTILSAINGHVVEPTFWGNFFVFFLGKFFEKFFEFFLFFL